MTVSAFDLYKIGIGPSSSHTVGPMAAAGRFARGLVDAGCLPRVMRLKVELFGSLAWTGRGHGTPLAVMSGLEGETPEQVDPAAMPARGRRIAAGRTLQLAGQRTITFDVDRDLLLNRKRRLAHHPNGMVFAALDAAGHPLVEKTYYSIGGGFIQEEGESPDRARRTVPYPFVSGRELLDWCSRQGMSIADLMWANECALDDAETVRRRLLAIWATMQGAIESGCHAHGELPGDLHLRRRAPDLYARLNSHPERQLGNPLSVMDWVMLYALAVSEENAAGGRIVTAPTNGAAGILPAVLNYYWNFTPGAHEAGVVKFLLTAAAIGTLYKINASISGAEVGCQGEVGSACSMAAGALTEALGGTPAQVENAAEIAMEHNLGLTCDPIGGLVQVPCIERNAMAAIKAISASRMALQGDGLHLVSLDQVIRTMGMTGKDMREKYKETSRGGLAVSVPAVPVSRVEC